MRLTRGPRVRSSSNEERIGLSTFFFKRMYPDATVIATEADPVIFKILAGNVREHGLTGVELKQAAVWSRSGTVRFQQEGGYSGRISKPSDQGACIDVLAISVDELFAGRNVDFPKLDIEGAEYEILVSNAEVLCRVDSIFIKYHSFETEPQTLDEILTLLSIRGFRYHIQEARWRPRRIVNRHRTLAMDSQANICAYRCRPPRSLEP